MLTFGVDGVISDRPDLMFTLRLGLAWNALLVPGPQAGNGRVLLYLLSPFVARLNGSTQLSGASLPWQDRYSATTLPWFASLGFYGVHHGVVDVWWRWWLRGRRCSERT